MDPVSKFFDEPWRHLIRGPDSPPEVDQAKLWERVQEPYERRVARAGGVPFEGPVDWGGIGAAIFGGPSAAERDAALLASRAPIAPADPSKFDPVNPGFGPTWEQFSDYTSDPDAWGHPKIDPESGMVFDTATGAYYPPNRMPTDPGGEKMDVLDPVTRNPIEGLRMGLDAERRRLAGYPNPPEWGTPFMVSNGGINSAPLPGQTEAPM